MEGSEFTGGKKVMSLFYGMCASEWNCIIRIYKQCLKSDTELAKSIIEMLDSEWDKEYIAEYLEGNE